ncbi:proton-conducting transporter membrane subunit [Zavarzinia compransoris]|uniref:NADH:quinone oxidoreductase/Mrp antiporter transmembrane domain-containing protein n=1 Tax=Zavarzinia compransoris TaxID=1264899 RepID=A0A317DXZ2_9PROT|nr:proton-conducting transporter membrane subunit [Zavarzinia compransoris]PWR19588.1 hypothetical protein DKG75_14030 [Zavarzinia compransoris]TDP40428.1 multicomponent Na+:H+ antiporter subunit D [Zavarzinia compransoris]
MTAALAFDPAALPPGWPLLLAGLLAAAIAHPVAHRVAGWAGVVASLALIVFAPGPGFAPLDGALVLAFHLAAAAGLLFAAGQRDRIAVGAGLVATGAGVAALASTSLAGLMIWTEVIAIASALIVMAGGSPEAVRAGLAYLLLQVLAGVLLLAAIAIGPGGAPLGAAGIAVLIALGIKAALPPAHGWLIHAYPAASPTGTLFLSAIATKVAVVALARLYPGEPLLLWLGLVMAVGGVLPTLFERHWRRLLAWALVSQLGVMVIGIGIGSPEALAGTGLLAVGHVLYASLLFLVAGSLEARDGRAPRGLRPAALAATLSIGLPGLAGYGGKAVIGEALIHAGLGWADIVIVVVGAIVFATAGLRPLIERCAAAPGAPALPLREGLAVLLLTLAGFAVGSFGALLTPHAGAAFHLTPLLVQGAALALVSALLLSPLGRALPGRDGALMVLAVPQPGWAIGAIDLFRPLGTLLARLGARSDRLLAGGGRIGGRGLLGLSRLFNRGALGDSVLWTLTVLTIVLIVSFG